MSTHKSNQGKNGLLREVDAITVKVPSLDEGLAFYQGELGHELKWRNDTIGQAALWLPNDASELVLTTSFNYEPNWLVDSVDDAVEQFLEAGGKVVSPVEEIPVGRLAVVEDPFGNTLVLLDLTKGLYQTNDAGEVTGVA